MKAILLILICVFLLVFLLSSLIKLYKILVRIGKRSVNNATTNRRLTLYQLEGKNSASAAIEAIVATEKNPYGAILELWAMFEAYARGYLKELCLSLREQKGGKTR